MSQSFGWYTTVIQNFYENFTLANRVKRHICEVLKSQLEHDLPTSVNDIVILPFRESFIFVKLHSHEVSQK